MMTTINFSTTTDDLDILPDKMKSSDEAASIDFLLESLLAEGETTSTVQPQSMPPTHTVSPSSSSQSFTCSSSSNQHHYNYSNFNSSFGMLEKLTQVLNNETFSDVEAVGGVSTHSGWSGYDGGSGRSTSILSMNDSFVLDLEEEEEDSEPEIGFDKDTIFEPTPVLSLSSSARSQTQPQQHPQAVIVADPVSSTPTQISSESLFGKKREFQENNDEGTGNQPLLRCIKKQRLSSFVESSSKDCTIPSPFLNFEDPIPTRFREYQADQWSEKFQELCDFIQTHGHCHVPRDYTNDSSSSNHTATSTKSQLSRWLKRQRYQYKLKMEGKSSTMTNDRIKALEALPGFVWNSHIATWEERLGELMSFQKSNGHCNVPSIYEDNQKLATWVKCQRRQYKLYQAGSPRSNMTVERIQRLSSMGFVWEIRSHVPKNSTCF